MSNSLSARHISTNLASYEAARTGFFSLIVDDIDNLVSAAYTGDPNEAAESDKIGLQAQEYLKLNVVKAPVPHFNLKVEEFKRGNDTVKFAGVPTFNSGGNIVVDDIVGLDTKSILMAWQALAYNVYTRKGGRMKDYKKNCTLVEYTQDFMPIRSWTMYGCWISDINESDFDKENDGKRQITANFVYDFAIMESEVERNNG
jgi:hypothetical protein